MPKWTEAAHENITYLITKEGGKRQNLAHKLGMAPGTLSKHLNNKSEISDKLLSEISKAYGYDDSFILNQRIDRYSVNYRIFNGDYYAYMLSSLDNTPMVVDEINLKILERSVTFEIKLTQIPSKTMFGQYTVYENSLNISLTGKYEALRYDAFISMPFTKAPPACYYGGLGIIVLPSEGFSVPCAQRIIISRYKMQLNQGSEDLDFLKQNLQFEKTSKHIKVYNGDDERVYLYIKNHFRKLDASFI